MSSLISAHDLWLLIDPVKLSWLPADYLLVLEPECNLFLGAVDAIGAVADIAADVLDCVSFLNTLAFSTYNGIVAANRARSTG